MQGLQYTLAVISIFDQTEFKFILLIIKELNACDLVVLRDPETLGAVHDCGEVPEAIVGAEVSWYSPFQRCSPTPGLRSTVPSEGLSLSCAVNLSPLGS